MILKTIILLILCTGLCESQKSYINYSLLRAIPVNEEQVEFLGNLTNLYDVQMWKEPGNVMKSVDFSISPEDKDSFLVKANLNQMYLTTISTNVQELFNAQTVTSYIRRQMTSYNWHNYYRTNDIYEWLGDLASSYKSIMKLFSIGVTLEKRHIYAVQIKHSTHITPDLRSTVIIEGGIHAREWISTAVVTYLIYKVLHAPADTDAEFQQVAFSFNWVFVPLVNPDGYEYSHTKDRLWRKNRNKSGVDLNRNFDNAFGTIGVSKEPSSDIYCGEKAFSELESSAMRYLLDQYKDDVQYYVAFHSYGQYLIIPYAHLKEHVENYDEIHTIGLQMADRIKRKYGTQYFVGTAYDTVGYATSGVSGCWAKKAYEVPHVITFELRDEGMEGFALSPKYILPTCKETVDGVVVFLNAGKDKLHEHPLGDPSGSDCRCLKNVVLLLNFILFITLCFDYSLMFLFQRK